jgi:DNA polymerase-3 subunit beta
MKFSTQLSDFQKLIQKVMPAVPARAAYDALEHILLILENNELTAIASDNEITIKSTISVEGTENGQILIPAKKTNEIVKVLDSTKEIHFECSADEFMIKIVSGKGKYQINGMDSEEYIELPELFDVEISGDSEAENNLFASFKKEEIQRLAGKTYFGVSQDEYRLNMSGVLFQFRENYVNAVSTDSFRLIRATLFAGEKSFPREIDITIPSRAIEICRKIDSDLTMLMDGNGEDEKPRYLRMDIGNTIVVTRLIDESFPKYEAIIPHSSSCQATFDVSELLGGVKRVAPVANEKNKKCRFEFSVDKLKIITENEDSGEEATDEIPCELTDAEEFSITFNIKYLEEIMQNITPNDTTNNLVVVHFVSPDKAALIKPKSEEDLLIMILMPIRMA